MAANDLEFKAGLNDSAFQAGLKRMEAAAGKAAKGVANTMAGYAAGALSIGKLVSFGSDIVDIASDIHDVSAALNISTDALQGQQAAFAMAGVDAEKYRMGMFKISEAQQAVINDDDKMRTAFETLGMSFEQVASSGVDELVYRMADGLSSAEDHGKALSAVLDILGSKSGTRFAQALIQGRSELQGFAESAKKIKPDAIVALEKAGDAASEAMRQLKVEAAGVMANEAIKKQIGAGQPPQVKPLSKLSAKDPRLLREQMEDKERNKAEAERALEKADDRLTASREAIDNFNSMTPDERRESIRSQRDADRIAARESRILKSEGRIKDARSGIGKLRKEEAAANFAQGQAAGQVSILTDDINALAKAIAGENAKLITAP